MQKKIDEISDSIVPPAEGTEDDYVFLEITDDEDLTYSGGSAGDRNALCGGAEFTGKNEV